MTDTGSIRASGEIKDVTNRLKDRVDFAVDKSNQLADIIAPILKPNPLDEKSSNVSSEMGTEHGKMLQSIVDNIDHVNDVLNRLIDEQQL